VLEAGLLDEILVYITPILLGDGVRLFSDPGGMKVKLDQSWSHANTTGNEYVAASKIYKP
jgi:riboflavin biosynthesis pyrimidine reductase